MIVGVKIFAFAFCNTSQNERQTFYKEHFLIQCMYIYLFQINDVISKRVSTGLMHK